MAGTERRLAKALRPKVKTGECRHCHHDMFNQRKDAKFCSAKCRTAACRKVLPPPPARELARLQALVQQLESENERLQTLVQQLKTDSDRPAAVSLTLPDSSDYQAKVAATRMAKAARETARINKINKRRGR